MRSTTCVFRDAVLGRPDPLIRSLKSPGGRGLVSLIGAISIFLNCFGTRAHAQEATPDLIGEESHPGLGLEAMYTQAVITFNRRQLEETLQTLDSILKESPENLPALELKALTLKAKGEETQSEEVYKKLIEIKPENERGPYYFELGSIYYKQKKYDQAVPLLEKSRAMGFNPVPSSLFLGLMALETGDYASAERHFRRVKSEGVGEYVVMGRYFLGLVYFKTGYAAAGAAEVAESRRLAAEMPDNKTAQDIRKSANQILRPFSRGQWFANLAMMTQYDTNIAQIPTGSVNSGAASGQGTAKVSLTGGAGRMTSPLSTWQGVGSYRFSGNHNFSTSAQTYEYFTQTVSAFLNYRPLARTNGGFKFDGSYTFENLPQASTDSTSTTSYVYQKYNMGAELGPYFRYYFSRSFQLETDLFFRPQKFYQDDTQTGDTYVLKFLGKIDGASNYLNLLATLDLERNMAKGDDWKSQAYIATFGDAMRMTTKDVLTPTLQLSYTPYFQSLLSRKDYNVTGSVNFTHTFSPHFSGLADLTYIRNVSTEGDVYTYNRFITSLGVGWNL